MTAPAPDRPILRRSRAENDGALRVSLDAWVSLIVVAGVFTMLATSKIPPYLSILAGVVVMIVSGAVTPGAALAGFSNQGMITIAALFVVAAGLTHTGALTTLVQRTLGHPTTSLGAQLRVTVPVAAASAFLNNTPIVAMLLPVVNDWSRRLSTSLSQLLMPLSFAAVLGGLCTLIGTSTNLVVHGMLLDNGYAGLGMFDITRVGLPCAAVGLVYMLLFGRLLLPRRDPAREAMENTREYTLEMVVERGGPLEGRTIAQAGLRHLDGVYLMEVHRRGQVHPAIGPEERLEAEDQLVFVGMVDAILDLQRIPGLRAAPRQLFKLSAPRHDRWFVEAVISKSCPIVGMSIRDSHFRNRYNAVILAVAREGQRIRKRIGDIILQPGDVLFLEALPAFVEQQRNSTDFYLVSRIENASPTRRERAWTALAILIAMVVLAGSGLMSMLQVAIAAAAAMLVTGCCPEEVARRRVDWQLLLAIAGSFGLGNGLIQTGAAASVAHGMLALAGDHPTLSLAVVYGVTMGMSAVVTNNAAAVIMFPIAVATAAELGVDHMPFVMALMVASSASLATPLGYQTNLMVYGPGGYRFRDFVRFGLPLSLLIWVVAVWITPLAWPF
jgi:di/tricarboxylate transporter